MWWQHPVLDVGRAAGSTKPRRGARNWWNAKIQACFVIRSSLDSTTAGTVSARAQLSILAIYREASSRGTFTTKTVSNTVSIKLCHEKDVPRGEAGRG